MNLFFQKMDNKPTEVLTLDSDSDDDDDIQVESENIKNYGNYSSPVDISPELQKKLEDSVKKYSTNPGKIRVIKVFATKKNNNQKGTVQARFNYTNRQASHVINFGPVFNANFVNQVQGANCNPGIQHNDKPNDPLGSDVGKTKRSKNIPKPLTNYPQLGRGEVPLFPSSPGLLFSHTRKMEQSYNERKNLAKKHIPENLKINNSIPLKQTISTKQRETSQSRPTFPNNNDTESQQNCILSPHQNSISSWQKVFQQFQSQCSSHPFLMDRSENSAIGASNNKLKTGLNGKSPVTFSSLKYSSDDEEKYIEISESSDEELTRGSDTVNQYTGNSPVVFSPWKYTQDNEDYIEISDSSDEENSPLVWIAPRKVKLEASASFLYELPSQKTKHCRRSLRKTTSELNMKEKQYIRSKLLIQDDRNLGLVEVFFPEKGKGVMTTRSFKKKEFVLEFVGDIIDITTANKRETEYSEDERNGSYMFYFKYKDKNYCIDGTFESGRLGRLLNHSCKHPNLIAKVITVKKQPRLIFVAFRDIGEGEELLFDYGERDEEAIKENPWLLS